MDSSQKHNEIYSALALLLLFLSVIVGGYFYYHQRGIRENSETMVLPEDQRTSSTVVPSLQPTPDVADYSLGEKAILKIAIPNDITAVLSDGQGRQTGTLNGKVVNGIPLSEFTPDKLAGTVGWIIVENPTTEAYTLSVQGLSEKSLAVYAKNEEAREDMELINIIQPVSTFAIHFDPVSAENMITIN